MSMVNRMKHRLLLAAFAAVLPFHAGAFNPPDSDPDEPTYDGGSLPAVDTIEADGPFSTTVEENTGPSGEGWLVRPTNPGQDGIQHPIFIWGPGAGTGPAEYEDHLRRFASHGFVVYSEVSTSSGAEMIDAIDWLIDQDARSYGTLSGMLDTTEIAVGGHSRGSVGTFNIASDSRIRTTIHVAGGSFDGTGPYNLHQPAAYICGEDDTFATPNCERDYENTSVPVWFTIMGGSSHTSAARDGLPQIVAWLRWHLADEIGREEMFIGTDCYFCGGDDEVQYKNW